MNDLPLLNAAKEPQLPARGCHNCANCVIGPGMGNAIYPQCRAEPPKIAVMHSIQMGIQGPQLAAQAITMYPRIDLHDPGCAAHAVKLAVMN